MKYELLCLSGKFDIKYGFKNQWALDVEGKAVFPGRIRIAATSSFAPNETTLHIDEIPARVDLDSNGNIWLQDEGGIKYHPSSPFSLAPSRVFWLKGEREKADIEEIGELIQA